MSYFAPFIPSIVVVQPPPPQYIILKQLTVHRVPHAYMRYCSQCRSNTLHHSAGNAYRGMCCNNCGCFN